VKQVLSWLLFGLGLAAAAGAYFWWQGKERDRGTQAHRGMPPIPATLAPVERGTLEANVALTGTVASIRRARVGFAIGGSLASLSVREGDVVAENAPLAALDDRDQAARLAAAEAETALARAELAVLQAGTRPEEVRRFAAQVQAAEADLSWTRSEVERMRPLASSRVVSVSTYEEWVSRRDAAQARLEGAREALALAEAGTRAEDLEVQRKRVASKEATEALAQREIDKTKLVAPFAGQVVRRLAAPGDAVSAGQAVVELVDLGRREVELEIPARHAPRIGEKARVDLTVDERPDFTLSGTLDARIQAADERSRSFRGIVRLGEGLDDEGLLKPGTFVRATLHLEPLSDRLLVPSDAVRVVESGSIVVKAVPPPPGAPPAGPPGAPPMPPMPTAAWVPVRVLGTDGGKSAVEPMGVPLEPGDQVVVVGVDRMFPGAVIMPRDLSPGAGARGGAAPDRTASAKSP
jgi:HlyD family secretion protein